MGLVFEKLKQIELSQEDENDPSEINSSDFTLKNTTANRNNKYKKSVIKFPDLECIPSELSLEILKHLNATDLCLASCVWSSLANDDTLWHGLCKNTWPYASVYNRMRRSAHMSYRKVFLLLDEATLTFNVDWKKGLDYMFKENLLDNTPLEIAKFINSTKKLNAEQREKFFKENKAVLENVIILQNYENQFLPNALRKFFSKIEAPKERNSYLSLLLEKFSKRFCACNPQLGLSEDSVYILCFSLILLSVDLSSPAVKNKMSKREFIKNTRNALPNINTDFTGHLYDNIYLNGNIAKQSRIDQETVLVR